MKISARDYIALAALCALLLFAPGCSSPTVQTFGPVVAQVAAARLAVPFLEQHPGSEAKLEAVAAALDEVAAGQSAAEITDAAIRAFVTARAPKWGLLPAEQQLVTDGLIAARAAYLKNTGALTIALNDPRAGVWIAAIRDGLRTALATHRAQVSGSQP